MDEIIFQVQEAAGVIDVDAPASFSRGDIEAALRVLHFVPTFVSAKDAGGDYLTYHFTI